VPDLFRQFFEAQSPQDAYDSDSVAESNFLALKSNRDFELVYAPIPEHGNDLVFSHRPSLGEMDEIDLGFHALN
jgi:hypothetical protein